jgi:polar amino acid transport system substrate-binding protein
MSSSRSTRRAIVWTTCAVLPSLLFVTACSSSKSSGSSGTGGGSTTSAAAGASPSASAGTIPTATKDAAIAAKLPAAVASAGALKVASDATYPPLESIASDGKTVIGADADIAAGIGQVLGLKVTIANTSFDTIIPSLQSGKFDLGMSGFNDTKKRQAIVDFVDYYKGGSSFFVKASGGATINGLSDLCGKKVSVEKGTTQQDDATAQSTACTTAGKSAVTLLVYPDQNSANLAVSSGRADVGIADSPVAQYQVKQSGGLFKISGSEYGSVLHGIALPKGNGMAPVISAAVKSLIDQGVYAKIMAKWGIGDDDKVSDPTVNGATS